MKRKVAGISLLICLLAPIATTYFFLQFQKKQVKSEVKRKMIAGIDKEELVLLKFTEAETKRDLWWKHSNEFEYRGEMYDVLENKAKGDSIYYWCWWDHKETKLNKQFDDLLTKVLGNNQQRQEKKSQLADFFKKLFHENHAEQFKAYAEKNIRKFYYSESFSSIYHIPPVPPPPRS